MTGIGDRHDGNNPLRLVKMSLAMTPFSALKSRLRLGWGGAFSHLERKPISDSTSSIDCRLHTTLLIKTD